MVEQKKTNNPCLSPTLCHSLLTSIRGNNAKHLAGGERSYRYRGKNMHFGTVLSNAAHTLSTTVVIMAGS